MFDLNNVSLIGRLVRDVELKTVRDDLKLAKFTIANNVGNKTETNFIDCVAFGKMAENASKYLKKGDLFALTGQIKQNKWEKDGKKYSRLEIIVNSLNFLSVNKKTDSSETSSETSNDNDNEDYVDDNCPF